MYLVMELCNLPVLVFGVSPKPATGTFKTKDSFIHGEQENGIVVHSTDEKYHLVKYRTNKQYHLETCRGYNKRTDNLFYKFTTHNMNWQLILQHFPWNGRPYLPNC
jgi:hypothetical protein